MKFKVLIVALVIGLCGFAAAQGMLPKAKEEKPAPPPAPYVLIGGSVPQTLTVVNSEGQTRSLLSYKSANDILVVGFYSPRCSYNELVWKRLYRLHEQFKGWHVSFVGVRVNSTETLDELQTAMQKAGLPYPAVRDVDQQVAKALNITATPQIVVIDESGYLRYRGALDDSVKDPNRMRPKGLAKPAIEAVISHIEYPKNPEPTDFIGCEIQ
jgi:peroxiredoxin